jgi:hypothetical protein
VAQDESWMNRRVNWEPVGFRGLNEVFPMAVSLLAACPEPR